MNILIKNLIIKILFLSLISINFSLDCNECGEASLENKICNNNQTSECKWFQIDKTTYQFLPCVGINESKSQYYTKGVTIDGKIYCRQIGINGFPYKKIIDGTNQIIRSCQELGLYELGDKCYHSATSNTIANDDTKTLKCKYKNYIETQDNGLQFYICLNEDNGENENSKCPDKFKYFDPETKECLTKCPSTKQKISIITDGDKTYYQCTAKCNKDGYDKEYTVKSNLNSNINIYYCYQKCPIEAPYYYINNNVKKCVEKCDKYSNAFFLEEDGKCTNDLTECSNQNLFLINSKIKYYECKDSLFDKCPNNYPYQFVYNGKTFCLSSCEDTNTSFFNNKQTYLYIKSSEEKICTNIHQLIQERNII